MPTVTYYYNCSSQNPLYNWKNDVENIIDGDDSTAGNDAFGAFLGENSIQLLISSQCIGNVSGQINTVELWAKLERTLGYDGYLKVIPYFNGTSSGNHLQAYVTYDEEWFNWDITDDPKGPIGTGRSWNWSDIKDIDCMVSGSGENGGARRIYQVELRIGYTNPSPVTNLGGSKNLIVPRSCLELDGTASDYLEATLTSGTKNYGNYSITMWVKPDQWGTDHHTLYNECFDTYWINSISDDYWRNRYFTHNETRVNELEMPILKTGYWYHLAFIHDSSNSLKSIYVDGNLHNYTNIGVSSSTSKRNHTYIGKDEDPPYDNFDGTIHDVRIYLDTILTSNEIERLSEGLDILNKSPTYQWKLDERKGDEAEDCRDSNDCTINGCEWVDRSLTCWNTRWDEGNWDVTVETFMNARDRNFLFGNVTPGAVRELYNILGTPKFIDTTYKSGNTLIYEPISGYGVSSLRQRRTIGIKNIQDTFLTRNLFSIKIEGNRLDIE